MRVLLLLLLVLPLVSGHYDDDTKKPKEDYDDEWMDVGEEEFKKQEHHFVHENRPPTDQPPAQKDGDDKELELMDQQIKRNFRLRRELGINMNDDAYDDSWMGNNDKEMDADLGLTKRSGEGMGWCENPGKYLGGYSSGERKYDDLETAQSECLLRNDCGGITYEVGSKKYTLRRGTTPKDSPSGEISWTRCIVGCSEAYEAEVDSLAEQITEAVTGKDLGLVKSYLNSTEGSLAVFKHDLLSRMSEAGDCIDLNDEVRNLASEKTISSDCFGSTSSAMVDIDGSTAYCKEETAEFVIDIEKPSVVNEIRIQWWGWSKAAEYDIYAKNEFDEGSEYVKFLDQSDEKVDGWFNHWSYIGQIENTVITKLKFELRNGRLDPWSKKNYFGIRHLQIIGLSSEVVVDVTKKMKVSPDAAALIDEDPTTTWSGEDFEVELTGICDIETLQFQWDKEPMSIALTYSVGDDDLGELQGTEPFDNVSISDFASSIKVDISGEDAVLKGITGKGTRYGAKDILKQKVDLFYEDHSFVRTYISDSISEFDYED